MAFVLVIALTLGLVSVLVINRLDDYFTRQQTTDLARAAYHGQRMVGSIADAAPRDGQPVVECGWRRQPARPRRARGPTYPATSSPTSLAQADVIVRFGLTVDGPVRSAVRARLERHGVPARARRHPPPGQARERTSRDAAGSRAAMPGRAIHRARSRSPTRTRIGPTAINNVTSLLSRSGCSPSGSRSSSRRRSPGASRRPSASSPTPPGASPRAT